jgi:toxin ParE1/3/4
MAAPRFHLSRRARADLDSIADYLASQSAIAPRRVLVELWNTFEVLAANPEIGNRRDDLHPNVRMFTPSRPASSYIVFYYPRANGIEISDVIHAARNWPGMFASGER